MRVWSSVSIDTSEQWRNADSLSYNAFRDNDLHMEVNPAEWPCSFTLYDYVGFTTEIDYSCLDFTPPLLSLCFVSQKLHYVCIEITRHVKQLVSVKINSKIIRKCYRSINVSSLTTLMQQCREIIIMHFIVMTINLLFNIQWRRKMKYLIIFYIGKKRNKNERISISREIHGSLRRNKFIKREKFLINVFIIKSEKNFLLLNFI